MYTTEAAQALTHLIGEVHQEVESPVILKALLDHDRLAYASLRWSEHEDHAVYVSKVEDGRVYFRNPHGPSDGTEGEYITDEGPKRRLERGDIGLESMELGEFIGVLSSAAVPTSTLRSPEVMTELLKSSRGLEEFESLFSFKQIEELRKGLTEAGAAMTAEERTSFRNISESTHTIQSEKVALALLFLCSSDLGDPKVAKWAGGLAIAHPGVVGSVVELLPKGTPSTRAALEEMARNALGEGDLQSYIPVVRILSSVGSRADAKLLSAVGNAGLCSEDPGIRYESLVALARNNSFYLKRLWEVEKQLEQDYYVGEVRGDVGDYIKKENILTSSLLRVKSRVAASPFYPPKRY